MGREEDNFQIRTLAEAVAKVVPDCAVTFAEGGSSDNRNYNVSFAKVRDRMPEFRPAWDVERGGITQRFAGHTGGIDALDMTADGRTLITASDDRRAILWDLAGDRRLEKAPTSASSPQDAHAGRRGR